jgi:hypothetical protein
MEISDQQKKYYLIALDALAQDYDDQGEATHAENVRQLYAYTEAQKSQRTGMTPEMQRSHQQRINEAMHEGDVTLVRERMTSYYMDVVRYEADPPAVFAPALLQMVQATAKESAISIVFMVRLKLERLVSDPAVSSPEDVFTALMALLEGGRKQLEQSSHEDLWKDDPHLAAAIAEMRESQAQA